MKTYLETYFDLVLKGLAERWRVADKTGHTPTAADIAADMSCCVTSVRNALYALTRDGRVVAIGSGSQRRYIPTDMYEEVMGDDR